MWYFVIKNLLPAVWYPGIDYITVLPPLPEPLLESTYPLIIPPVLYRVSSHCLFNYKLFITPGFSHYPLQHQPLVPLTQIKAPDFVLRVSQRVPDPVFFLTTNKPRFMNGLKFLFLGTALAATAISGCRKNDWVTVPNGRDKCELLSVSSTILSNEGEAELPLFTKSFVNGTYKLNSLFALYRNPAGGPAYPDPATSYPVTHSGQTMTVQKNGNESTVFHFDNNGKVTKALDQQFGTTFEYKFIYNGGKLQEIQQKNDEWGQELQPYYWIMWDQGKKNVLEEQFGYGGQTVIYSFNNNKKVKGQFVPDQKFGDSHTFVGLVKYLNLCPELQSQNLITGSQTLSEDYPGWFTTVYSGHVFDAGGRITRLTATSTYQDNDGANESAIWNFSWNCLK